MPYTILQAMVIVIVIHSMDIPFTSESPFFAIITEKDMIKLVDMTVIIVKPIILRIFRSIQRS